MEMNERRSGIAVLALLLALIALGVAVGAFVATPQPAPDRQGEIDGLQKEIAALNAELAKDRQRLDTQLSELARRVEASAVAQAPAVAPAPVAVNPVVADQIALAKQVEEQVRQALLHNGVDIRMAPGELPETVKAAMAKVAPGVAITRCEQRQQNGQDYFRLRGMLKGEQLDYRIKPDGGILEADLPLDVVPGVVAEAAAKAVPGFQMVDATQRMRDGAVIFDIGGRDAQRRYELRLSETGQVINVDAHGGHNHGGARPQGGQTQKPPAPPPVQENF